MSRGEGYDTAWKGGRQEVRGGACGAFDAGQGRGGEAYGGDTICDRDRDGAS